MLTRCSSIVMQSIHDWLRSTPCLHTIPKTLSTMSSVPLDSALTTTVFSSSPRKTFTSSFSRLVVPFVSSPSASVTTATRHASARSAHRTFMSSLHVLEDFRASWTHHVSFPPLTSRFFWSLLVCSHLLFPASCSKLSLSTASSCILRRSIVRFPESMSSSSRNGRGVSSHIHSV